LSADFDEQERKEKELEAQRSVKWLKMVKNWEKFTISNREKLQRRIYKGIPDKLRRPIWLKMLNVEKQQNMYPNVYSKMLRLAYDYSTEIRQIDNDINRCFRDHEHFKDRYSTKQQQLFNVLIAYSMYNMELSYCQGKCKFVVTHISFLIFI
jgi:hypothetical protein